MRYLFRLSMLISLFIVAFIAYTPARAADTTITDCTFANLSAAVTAANTGGGTIDFACSTSPTTIVFTNQLTIDANVTINGGGVVIFNGGGATRLFTVNSTRSLTLDGLTLQNGLANVGGAIFNNSGTVNISNSTLSSNFASFSGGAIFNNFNSVMNITNSIISGNAAGDGSAILTSAGNTATSVNTHYEGNGTNNICLGAVLIADNGGNTRINSGGCPGSTPINLSVSALTCNGNNAEFTINGGDANFDITGTGTAQLPITDSPAGLITLTGPATWTGITVRERLGERQSLPLGDITCPTPLSATAVCFGNDLQVNILTGDAPFQVTASPSLVLATGLPLGTNLVSPFGSQTGVTVEELGGDTQSLPLGDIDCTPNNLSASAVCVGNDLYVTIGNGEPLFQINNSSGMLRTGLSAGLHIISNAGTQTGVTVEELSGDTQNVPLGNFNCVAPVTPPTTSTVTVLGCALDNTDGVEVANAPDNTYCRILMKNGGVVSYSGAIPADLIGLGVISAVDVYRLEGGASVNTFPEYARICLAGEGRFFYMDGRNAPRYSVEMGSEFVNGMTCAWIPAPGTVILTN